MIHSNNFKPLLFIVLSFLCFASLLAQEIVAKKGSYGIDHNNKIIVWHESNLDSIAQANTGETVVNFQDKIQFTSESSKLAYSQSYLVTHEAEDYHLYITKLPIIHIKIDTVTLNNEKKLPGHFTYFNDNKYQESEMGIRQRGNLSLTYPKKSYDIELKKGDNSKESRDLKFKGLRNDDDWILDGLFNESLKLRSHVAAKLWSKIHEPYYISKEPKAKNGFGAEYIELFRNNEYRGLYSLSESIDRKQLKLKKNQGNTVHGELFKANSYDGGPAFEKAGKSNVLSRHYVGFRMEYPVIDNNSYWNNLSQFLDLVVNQSDETFVNKIDESFHISNAIDYYILVNLTGAVDNLGKNYYLGKYDKNEPYFFIAWDLDSTFGNAQEGRRIANESELLSNGLFDRLLALNPQGYKTKLKSRWTALRETALSDEKVSKRFEKLYNRFTEEKIYERDQKIWTKMFSDEYDYYFLKKWINARMLFLDAYFESL